MPVVIKPRSSLRGQMLTFVGGRPTVLMLCLSSTLLMWLKVDPTKGKKATDVISSLGVSSQQGGFRV
jgi:hypothetical protein